MNLIEKYGSYEKAKELRRYLFCYVDGEHYIEVDKALLEYRRQHDMYEVGDKVVYKPSMVQGVIFTVIGFDDFGWMKTEAFFEGFDHPKRFSEDPPFSDIRHATDEEIKAGRRL